MTKTKQADPALKTDEYVLYRPPASEQFEATIRVAATAADPGEFDDVMAMLVLPTDRDSLTAVQRTLKARRRP